MNGMAIARLLIDATDTEFVEVFTYLYKEYCKNDTSWGEGITADDVKNMDIKALANKLAEILDEIINDTDVDTDAWFKQEV